MACSDVGTAKLIKCNHRGIVSFQNELQPMTFHTEPAKKKLFLSSTCYDSGTRRALIEAWATKQGFIPMLSDRSGFPVDPDIHRHDVCLANAKTSDLFVLLVGGRFGAPYYRDETISVTWAEYRAAAQSNVRMVVFVEKAVWDERNSFKRDPSVPLSVTKDARVFAFIDELQADIRGRWFEIFSSDCEIGEHLSCLTTLFSISVPLLSREVKYYKDKHALVNSLSSEAQHHIRLIYSDIHGIAGYELWDVIEQIPQQAREFSEVHTAIDGFTVYIEKIGEERYLVRPTDIGMAVREELERVQAALY